MANLYCKYQKGNSQRFRDNWDATFRKDKEIENDDQVQRSGKESGTTGNKDDRDN